MRRIVSNIPRDAARTLVIALLAALSAGSGCVTLVSPMKTERASLGPRTPAFRDLTSLPVPKEKIAAAVYKFRDQTGQYKSASTASTFSTAVTQGATSILLRALEESGWFIVIEREGLSNLLNERKIIRSSRAEYLNNSQDSAEARQPLLPPLLFAGVLLEGGIISYESNILTGGSGLKYFGTGASSQYRQDRVTVYLRAIATQSGRVLKTVYASKTILSQSVDFNVYKFVDFQRLLEVETGYSYNEPPEMCVTEAIEKAVQSLIIEGIFDNLWALKNAADKDAPAVKSYVRERENSRLLDALGFEHEEPGRITVSGFVGGTRYMGDYANAATEATYGAGVSWHFTSQLAASVRASTVTWRATPYFSTTALQIEMLGRLNLLPGHELAPYVLLGGGFLQATITSNHANAAIGGRNLPMLSGAAGIEYRVHPQGALFLEGGAQYALKDEVDGRNAGLYNDYSWSVRAGVAVSFWK